MKYIGILIIVLVLVLTPYTVESKDRPLPYKINAPHIIQKNHKITIEWLQTQPVLVTVYKLSYLRNLANNCYGIETLGAQCIILWQRTNLTGNIRITDKGYHTGDQYFIQQNVFLTHNGGYGPFIPTYR